jgi:molybdenum cofactor synthesis domain-containing protein
VARIVAAPETLRYLEARSRVLDAVEPGPEELVPLERARGRAARRQLAAALDLPPFRNSSMDGVAVRVADLAAAGSRAIELPVTAAIAAGASPSILAAGSCAWIMTGAPVPDGADAVVPIEELEPIDGADPTRAGGKVRFTAAVARQANIRESGADVHAGERLWVAGRELSAQDIGLLAALGEREVRVGRRPRVAVISTGDELLEPGERLKPGAIYDSNRPMLGALLEECGAELVSSERAGDDPARVGESIARALASADAAITIGGVSAGAFDPVKLGLAALEGISLWRVTMKPGRPQAFGAPGGRLFFGLPGNPASVACVFEALVRPALRKWQGFSQLDRPQIEARAAHDMESRAGRTDFVRVTLTRRDGAWWAAEAGAQISGHVTPQSRAHGLLIVSEETPRLTAGQTAPVWVLRWPENG